MSRMLVLQCQKKVAERESGKDRAATVASMATGGNVTMEGDTDAGGGGGRGSG